jgi:hypothetical protein
LAYGKDWETIRLIHRWNHQYVFSNRQVANL